MDSLEDMALDGAAVRSRPGHAAARDPWLRPGWPTGRVPTGVAAVMSTRAGGVSAAPFDTMNLRAAAWPAGGDGAPSDDDTAVAENRRRFAAALGAPPVWLRQVHGADVVRLAAGDLADGPAPVADASFTTEPGVGCAVLVADCLPVLLAGRDGTVVGAAHAGWRGLAAGVVERCVAAMADAAGRAPADLVAWLGPCIGPQAFEVGADVVAAFGDDPTAPDPRRFVATPRPDGSPRWRANLPALARERLVAAGLRPEAIGGSDGSAAWCTHAGGSRFFSFRRDGARSGRMAAAIARVAG